MNFSPKARSFPPNITLWHILFYLIIATAAVWLILLASLDWPSLAFFPHWCPFLYPFLYIYFFICWLLKPSSELAYTISILGVYFLMLSLPVIPVVSSMYFKKRGRNLAFIALIVDLIFNLFNPTWAIGIDFVLIILLGIIFKKADEDAPIPAE